MIILSLQEKQLSKLNDWVNFISQGEIKTDVDLTFIVDKPYPASILKIYAKAKVLTGYKELISLVVYLSLLNLMSKVIAKNDNL